MGNLATTLKTIDWNGLREEGLKHLQAMAGHLWTDYQTHDPGVTIFELLCYAIDDLNTRLSQDIGVILAKDRTEDTGRQFFSPREVMTINPVTINDYRKLLIDLPGVKNAWFLPVTENRPTLYYDQDNSTLLYDYAPGAHRVALKGLWRVFIEKDEDVTDETQLKTAVIERLHAHRNLCEDFVEVNIMATETIAIFSDIEIAENADANEVMGKIYHDLAEFISPRVKQYSLKRMLQKGKTVEEIFTGPPLEYGFIDDDELGTGEKRKELHASDLIRIIMAHPEVKDVRNLYMGNIHSTDIRDKQEWALVVDDTKALVMEPFNGSKLRVFKDEKMCPVDAGVVETVACRIKKENNREIFDDPAMDLSETLGEASPALLAYSPLTYKLPATYGVSETGLPSGVSAERLAQAKQLRAYLLFFEQILVNYLKQLASFKHLFAFRQNRTEILKSYFTQFLPEELWAKDFPEIGEIITHDPTENLAENDQAFTRKNRILDHLLAQFSEKFSDYAFFGFKYSMTENLEPQQKERAYLAAKADFLENYPQLSRDRNKAANYLTSNNGCRQVDGLKQLIATKLGIELETGAPVDLGNSEEFYVVEHILFRPDGSMPLDFVCAEKIGAAHRPDPYSQRLTFVLPKNAGRFSNSRFRELVYATIANETPAHISYNVLEFNPEQMRKFVNTYEHFLREIPQHKQDNSAQYNVARNTLMELLGIGWPGLPVLHLDATDVFADGSKPEHGSYLSGWHDLSINKHQAVAETDPARPQYFQPLVDAPAFLRFTEETCLKLDYPLVQKDFSIAVVFRTPAHPDERGQNEEYYKLIAGVDAGSTQFSLGFTSAGNVGAEVGGENVRLESEAGCAHVVVLSRDQKAGEIRLAIDGVLQTTRQTTEHNPLNFSKVVIGPGVDCDLGEVIFLDSVLTGSRKEKLEGYLAQKWGIPLSAVSSIAIPALHLAADAGTSMIKDDLTNKVSVWQDLSESRKVVIPQHKEMQPVYDGAGIRGLPALQFDHSGLVIPNAAQEFFQADFTIGLVYQAQAGAGCLLDGTTTTEENEENGFSLGLAEDGALEIRGKADAVKLAAGLDQAHLVVITGQLASDHLMVTIWLDGKFYTNQEFTDQELFRTCPPNLTIGQSRRGKLGFKGKIGEVIIYNEALSAWQRQRLEQFLGEKWQIDRSGVDSVAPSVLHLDAARLGSVLDENGEPAVTGAKVKHWLDLGSTDHHGIQENSYRRPEYLINGINDLATIKFSQQKVDADDFYEDYLNVDRVIQSDFTMMVVFKPDSQWYEEHDRLESINRDTAWTEGVALIDADCSGRYNDFGLSFGITGEKMIVMGGIGDRLTQDHTIKSRELDFNHAHFVTFSREKASGEVKLYVDGLLQDQADLRDEVILNDSRTIKIGAFNSEGIPFHGLIGEIILFDQVLTEGQQRQIEEYLSTKWRIPLVNLPVDATGLRFHLDATVSARIARDKENQVTEWSDLNNFSQVTAVYPETSMASETETPPLYVTEGIFGKPALQFNNSLLTIAPETSSDQDFTLAIVYHALSPGNILDEGDEAGLVDHDAPDQSKNFGLTVTKNNTLGVRIGAQRIEAAADFNLPHLAMISLDQADGKVKIYVDGLLVASEAGAPQIALEEIKELTIGAIRKAPQEAVSKGYFHGNIGELFMFNRGLTERERQDLEQYLSLKWRIDISGVNRIVKPVLHLDAGKLSTVITDEAARVSQWIDLTGSSNDARQNNSARQPVYRQAANHGLGVLSFDGTKQTCLTLKPVVHDDFTVIIVYRAEAGDSSAYMPVARDSFMVITDGDEVLANTLWEQLEEEGYIDGQGNVLPKLADDDYILSLSSVLWEALQTIYKDKITAVLSQYSGQQIPTDAFTSIGGVDQVLAQTIWLHLQAENYINDDGRVLKAEYNPNKVTFLNFCAESAIINVLLAENWPAGAGIFDGNCAGDRGQPNKRDFGILVGKDGRLIAVLGVPDEKDYRVEQKGAFDQWQIAILTRVKDTGVVRLSLDDQKPVEKRIAQHISLKDSKRFTIGAVNTGGNHFTGDLAEIIVLNQVPADHELAAIRDHLVKKWGVVF